MGVGRADIITPLKFSAWEQQLKHLQVKCPVKLQGQHGVSAGTPGGDRLEELGLLIRGNPKPGCSVNDPHIRGVDNMPSVSFSPPAGSNPGNPYPSRIGGAAPAIQTRLDIVNFVTVIFVAYLILHLSQ